MTHSFTSQAIHKPLSYQSGGMRSNLGAWNLEKGGLFSKLKAQKTKLGLIRSPHWAIQRVLCIQILALLCICLCLYGCSYSGRSDSAKNARHLAWAVQGLSMGAELGLLGKPANAFLERDPNPNEYVGQLLFGRYCAPCHTTGKAPNIIEHRVTSSDAESDFYIIRYGIHEMPGFRTRLTRFQVLDILAYMKTDRESLLRLNTDSGGFAKRKKNTSQTDGTTNSETQEDAQPETGENTDPE